MRKRAQAVGASSMRAQSGDAANNRSPETARLRGAVPVHSEAVMLRAAFDAECRLAYCYEKALQCACDRPLASLWRARLEEGRRRAEAMARRLGRGSFQHARAAPARTANCLVEAMELALRNGDIEAAQAVARECVMLAEAQCMAMIRDEILADITER